MSKATLEFDLTDPDQEREFKVATTARDVRAALWEFENRVLRPMWKHGLKDDRVLTEAEMDIVEYIRERYYDCLREYNVDTDL